MAFPLSALLALLDLEELEVNIFRGASRDIGSGRVFGGQVLAQALVAAGRTVGEGRVAHSLHSYFILPGDVAAPIVYFVERLRDGRSFTTRRVTAIQHGQAIFEMSASFQAAETGVEHQAAMPDVPAPEDVESDVERLRAAGDRIPEPLRSFYTREWPLELRTVDPTDLFRPEARPPQRCVWLRATGTVPSDDALPHQSVLAYASDYGLLGTAFLPHRLAFQMPGVQAATLDHAIWFHRPFRADEWLLYATDSPSAAGARGFARGSVFTRDGRLVASVAQEGLIRTRGQGRSERSSS
jgi:acyl-CoA thioesterase II